MWSRAKLHTVIGQARATIKTPSSIPFAPKRESGMYVTNIVLKLATELQDGVLYIREKIWP